MEQIARQGLAFLNFKIYNFKFQARVQEYLKIGPPAGGCKL